MLQEARTLHEQLKTIHQQLHTDGDWRKFDSRFDRWKSRVEKWINSSIGPDEKKRFRRAIMPTTVTFTEVDSCNLKAKAANAYFETLLEDLETNPSFYASKEEATASNPDPNITPPNVSIPDSRKVFLVHGHDELNQRRLKDIINEEFGLEAIVMMAKPGAGRTLIEKFEQEGADAAYAMVLMTPDDMIAVSDSELFQSRPNVLFELGWFYGKLGRSRVCIVFKKGTQIPSDLDGVERVEFKDTPEEKIAALRKELEKAGMI